VTMFPLLFFSPGRMPLIFMARGVSRGKTTSTSYQSRSGITALSP
jgi:hypothetical protein